MNFTNRTRGIVAIIMAAALATVLIIVAIGVVNGVKLSEFGRDAGWAMLGALAGALITYLTTKSTPT